MKPAGYRILVEPQMPEEYRKLGYKFDDNGDIVSESGFVISGDEANRDYMAQTVGRVIDVGDTAYIGVCDDTPWCKKGDLIIYAKHVGRKVSKEFAGSRQLFLINDKDVELILESVEDNQEES